MSVRKSARRRSLARDPGAPQASVVRSQRRLSRGILLTGTSVLALSLAASDGALARPFGSFATSTSAPTIAGDAATAAAQQQKLARRLGSQDAAGDVLQEAYLRLQRMGDLGAVERPRAYLFRIALNIAADHRRSEHRRLARSETELLLRLEDDELDPERIAEGRSSVRLLTQALEELPARRRAIFIATRLQGRPYAEIAADFGISTRLLEREVKLALDHCRDRLEIKLSQKYGSGRSETSHE